eukprot:snap_masked-scaffold_19-processed-gene-5.10-mRNA-1 protein AED:1.00 eAED:1.00 QI:0/0/0/0/1/1/2/0/223
MDFNYAPAKKSVKNRNATFFRPRLRQNTTYSDLLIPAQKEGDSYIAYYEEEWIADNVTDFYEKLGDFLNTSFQNAFEEGLVENYGYPPKFAYKWKEKEQDKPEVLLGNIYIEKLFGWLETVIDEENTFDGLVDVQYPEDFRYRVRMIMKRMFRIFTIVYFNQQFLKLTSGKDLSYTLDPLFKHFIWFCWVWNFLPEKEEKAIIEKVASLKEEFNETKEKHYTY